jgi:hypothetical protein
MARCPSACVGGLGHDFVGAYDFVAGWGGGVEAVGW